MRRARRGSGGLIGVSPGKRKALPSYYSPSPRLIATGTGEEKTLPLINPADAARECGRRQKNRWASGCRLLGRRRRGRSSDRRAGAIRGEGELPRMGKRGRPGPWLPTRGTEMRAADGGTSPPSQRLRETRGDTFPYTGEIETDPPVTALAGDAPRQPPLGKGAMGGRAFFKNPACAASLLYNSFLLRQK